MESVARKEYETVSLRSIVRGCSCSVQLLPFRWFVLPKCTCKVVRLIHCRFGVSFLHEPLFVKFDDRLSKDKYDADQNTCQKKKNNNHCLVKTSFYSAVVKWVASQCY